MTKFLEKKYKILFLLILTALESFGCGTLMFTKKQKTVYGTWRYDWDEEWTQFEKLKWHKHDNFLYINVEKGWAAGTFGKVNNHDNYYYLRPVYKFTVVEPDKAEKEIVVRMGYIENENVLFRSNYLEGCWSEKVTFEPGSRVLDETVVRDYLKEKMELPSKCARKSPPF